MNVLATNFEPPPRNPPQDDALTRIQQLEQGQQRIETLMDNLLLAFQNQANNEPHPNPLDNEENGEENESRALKKKDVDSILAKAKEEDILKMHSRFASLQVP